MQNRSIKRVQQILDATAEIIAEKGSAGLSITGIAKRAGITAGSMYQYFPNKEAIVYALAEHYLSQIRKEFETKFAVLPKSRDDVRLMSLEIFDNYSEMHCEDPVVRDILMGASVNKETMDLDWEDTLQNQEFMFEISKPFYPEHMHEELKIVLLIFLQYAISSTKAAIESPKSQQAKILQIAREMFNAMWLAFDSKVDASETSKS